MVQEVIVIISRTLLIYMAVLLIMRIMGKREIGQLSPVDLVVAIMIAELAAIPMEDMETPIYHALVPMFVLMFAEIGFSLLQLRSPKMRSWLTGTATVIIRDGKIQEEAMRRSRYNLDDLLSQLRDRGTPNVQDVEFAVLETSGTLSIIPKSQKRPLTPADMGISTKYEGLPVPIILDGKVEHHNLQEHNLDESCSKMNWPIMVLQGRKMYFLPA
ncbi:hypothetical protein FTV88_3002 [Heliorestis convoluta]|uniref:YetF C-terminal domain-containing protein n=1 Tax=Heliorestis convoluta TaxID=356322 RepID=A0A5Q2N2N2_9FIRM|nr:DUF421 domain-containing protein [Heliorestis convoluta]QGG49077.1 hypothetical protein FTV88_3002 [Heliorestis convoluta]